MQWLRKHSFVLLQSGGHKCQATCRQGCVPSAGLRGESFQLLQATRSFPLHMGIGASSGSRTTSLPLTESSCLLLSHKGPCDYTEPNDIFQDHQPIISPLTESEKCLLPHKVKLQVPGIRTLILFGVGLLCVPQPPTVNSGRLF